MVSPETLNVFWMIQYTLIGIIAGLGGIGLILFLYAYWR